MSLSSLFSTFPKFVDEELDRRKDRDSLQDPKTPWMRMASGFKPEDGERRVLMGGDLSLNQKLKFGFEDLYEEQAATGEKYRPEPTITGITVDEQLESFECSVEWTANSISQVEELFPFFMNLGATVIVDFGWSDVPSDAIIDVSKEAPFAEQFKQLDKSMSKKQAESANPQTAPAGISRYNHPKYKQLAKGQGRYSFVAGYISNFSYSPDGNGQYSCTTEVMSISKALAKLSTHTQEYKRKKPKDSHDEALLEWVEGNLEKHLKVKSDSRPKEVVEVDGGKELNRREDAVPNHTYYLSWREIEYIINEHIGLESNNTAAGKLRNVELNSAGSVISNYEAESSGDVPLQLRSMDPLVCAVDVGGQSDLFRNFTKKSMKTGISENYPAAPSDWLDSGFNIDKKKQGLLYNLYVEYQLFVDALEKNKTIFQALQYMLERCSQACFDIWDFKIVIDSNSARVIDTNMTTNNTANSILNTSGEEHVFLPNTRQTVLRDFNFDTNLDDAIKGQIVFQNRAELDSESSGGDGSGEGPATNFRDDSTAKFFEKTFSGKDIVLGGGERPSKSEIAKSQKKKQSHDTSKFEFSAPLDVTREEAAYEFLGLGIGTEKPDYKKMRREVEKTVEQQGETTKYLFYTADTSGSSFAPKFSRKLQSSTGQKSPVNSNNVINIDAQLTLAGIGGFSAYQVLEIKNIPQIFNNVGVFQVDTVSHSVSIDDWTTELKTSFVVKNTIGGGFGSSSNQSS